MKYVVHFFAAALVVAGAARSDVIVKADNTNSLNDAASWTNGVAPGTADIAQWDATVTGTNNVALGASASWAGLRVLNPAGAVTINPNTANASLTVGTNGIDLASSTVNLTLSPSIVIGATQSWTIGGGRILTLFSANNTGTGTGDITVSRSGAGTAILSMEQNGNSACWRNFAGNWIFATGVTAIAQGQNGDALGRGSVTLLGGALAQTNGNWNFNNPIVIGPGGGTIESRSTSTGTRFMNLSGGISGSDPLAFNTTISGSLGEGFILDASNSFSGPVTINANAILKIGGSGTTNVLSNSNGTNGSLDNVTSITNNGMLRMGRTDGYTFRPDLRITGAGTFRVNPGCTATVQSASTLANTLTLNPAGTIVLTGDQTVVGVSGSSTETNGDVLGNGTLTIAAGSSSGFFYYGGLSGVTSLQLRVGAQTIALANGSSSGSGNYFILQRPPSPGLALDTGISTASRKDFGWINDTDDVLQLSSLTGYGAIRTDTGGIAGHPRLITVDQSVTTTFNGGLVAGGVNRNVIFNKAGTGSLTLAGFVGYQTAQSGVVNLNVSNGVLNVINDNATPANGTTGIWTTAGSGVLSFSSNGLGRGSANTIVMNGGTLRWNAGNAQDVSSRLLMNDGVNATFDTGAGAVTFASTPALGASGSAGIVKMGSGSLTLTTPCSYSGATTISNGTLVLAGSGSCAASAMLFVQAGTTLDVTGRADGSLPIGVSQTLAGAGTVVGNVNNDGTLNPGAPVGIFVINGGFAQTNGTFAAALESSSTYDQLLVLGSAQLGGALSVTLTNGFMPNVGDQFTIVQSLGLSGGFATTNLPSIGTNLWTIEYTGGGAVVLTVTNPPSAPAAGYDLFAQQITNSASRGYGSDPDGDGYANLLEYATGGNPTSIDTVASMNGALASGALQIVFTRNTNATDATLIVEGSSIAINDAPWNGILTNSNGTWSGPAAFSETGATNPVTVTVTDTAVATNRFLRLRITRP